MSRPVFTSTQRRVGGSVTADIKTRCASAGLTPDFSAQSIRSGFMTEASGNNMPLADAMAMGGHASTAAILEYFRQGQLNNSLAERLLDSPPAKELQAK